MFYQIKNKKETSVLAKSKKDFINTPANKQKQSVFYSIAQVLCQAVSSRVVATFQKITEELFL